MRPGVVFGGLNLIFLAESESEATIMEMFLTFADFCSVRIPRMSLLYNREEHAARAVAQLSDQLRRSEPGRSIDRFAPLLEAELGLQTLETVALLSDDEFQIAGFPPEHLQTLREAAMLWTEQNGWKREERLWYIDLLTQLYYCATYTGEQGNPITALLFRAPGMRQPFSVGEAMDCIKNGYVDYLCGVDIKMALGDPRQLDGSAYDRAHGEGLFKQIMSRMPSPPLRYQGPQGPQGPAALGSRDGH